MEIVGIRKVNYGKVKALVDIKTSEGFIIKGFRVVEDDNGFFVGMPSQRSRTGKFVDMVKLDSPQLKEMLEAMVLEAYRK